MQKYLTLSLSILLAACSSAEPMPMSLEDNMQNPLFAERYAEELVQAMVEFQIQEDPILEDAARARTIDGARVEWLKKAQVARRKQRDGMLGRFTSLRAQIRGEVLVFEDTVFFDTLFESTPFPHAHVYVSQSIDPRDGEFPDDTAVDLGILQSSYGAQEYAIPQEDDTDEAEKQWRTVVIWDNELELSIGFAQLN